VSGGRADGRARSKPRSSVGSLGAREERRGSGDRPRKPRRSGAGTRKLSAHTIERNDGRRDLGRASRVAGWNLWHRSRESTHGARHVVRRRARPENQVVGRDESPTDERAVPGGYSLERSSVGLLAAEHLQGPESMTAFQMDHLLPLVRGTVPYDDARCTHFFGSSSYRSRDRPQVGAPLVVSADLTECRRSGLARG
jgi:hypothetical protein